MPAQTDGLDATEIFVAGFQRIYIGAVGATAPTSITGTPASGSWTDLGYTKEDGLKLSFGRDVNEIMSSQALTPVRKLVTKAPKQITASFLQMNVDVMKLALGGGAITGTAGSGLYTFTPSADDVISEYAVIVEGTDGSDRIRFIYGRATLADKVEFAMVNTDAMSPAITLDVLDNSPNASYTIQSNLASWNVN